MINGAYKVCDASPHIIIYIYASGSTQHNGVVRCCVSQGLIDILTSLTRSAGAASRIFSLMDSLPDIDINRGIPVQAKDIKGNIEFRNVQFTYQMRPDHKVCLL
jgi:ABC-type multidrug transport system fused ATPase/permease subunit